ncbi:MAG TPA: DNA-binding protein [Firmicutes bacterium]|jgi:hypothetical protein|nr:DNA-binding protein [Bacillota bacterium]HBK69984.1 DNA-binding protein [Bacillota bacterium]HBT16080.1 DNA-binding protein [Bacillota bacterium]
MEFLVRMGLLYDFYANLLTKKQQKVFALYYLQNFSLAEIAEEEGTTRQAVHDLLQRTEKLLERWEDKLRLLEQYLQNKKMMQEMCCALKKLSGLLCKDDEVQDAFANVQRIFEQLASILEIEIAE